MRLYLGVSQDDGPRLQAAVTSNMEGHAVDAIIDDASHQYAETKATLEILFPFLRPGGAYIIEDWAWGHEDKWPHDLWADRSLMSPLLSELMLVCGHATGVIDKIEVDPSFVVLWRGPVHLPENGSFTLSDHYTARGFSLTL